MPLPPITLAVRDVTLIDGIGGPPLDHANVLVSGERIVAAGPAAQTPVPEGTPLLEGAGKWLIPGLVDLHVHVNLCGLEALPLWLRTGVTSVRDIGGSIESLIPARAELAAGTREGPRLFTHGPMIDGSPSGFGALPGGSFERLWSEVDRPEAARAEADRLLAAGVDGLKLYQGLPLESVRALLAHVGGRVPVTGHLTRTRASDAVRAGINCLEHNFVTPYNDVCRPEDRTAEGAGWHTPGFITRVHRGWANADLNAPHVREFIALLAESGVYYDPTLTWGTSALALEETEAEQGERHLTPTMQRRRELLAGRRAAALGATADSLRASAEKQLEFVSRLIEAGVLVMAGTDTGALEGIPGFTLHRELRYLVRCGMTPKLALERATRVAAEALRRADDQGTVRPGQRADLVLLDADPLAEIRNTLRVSRVVKDGRVYEPLA